MEFLRRLRESRGFVLTRTATFAKAGHIWCGIHIHEKIKKHPRVIMQWAHFDTAHSTLWPIGKSRQNTEGASFGKKRLQSSTPSVPVHNCGSPGLGREAA